ncbi:MAG: sugar ABC transporter substrate-binding protein [Stappiaceae bacterium]
MLRKNLKVTLLAATAAVFGMNSASAETLRVYFNAGHAYETYLEVIEQFEADNPGWDVAFEKFQWPDMRTKIVADFAASNPPDLLAEPGGWVPEFAQKSLIMPLTKYIDADGKDMGFPSDWQDGSVTRNTINGEVYGVQIHQTCATLVYNKDLLSEAGYDAPPTTWEEFRDVAKKTSKPGVFGFAPNPSFGYIFPFIYQNGGDWYDAETKQMTFGSPETQEAVQFLGDMIHKDKSAPPPVAGSDYEGPQRLFTAGRAAMIITGPWDVNAIRTGNPDLNWGVAPSITGEKQATIAGGVSLMIPKDAKHPDMAWELIKRLTAVDVEVASALQYGMTMPRKSWLANPQIGADPILSGFGECLAYAKGVNDEISHAGLYSSAVEETFKGAIDEVLYSGASAADLLPDAEKEANRLLTR